MEKIKHKHNIIPKHAGGSDDPSNLIELTVEEHAEAHRKLYEEHGRKGDYIAWKALSGLIDTAEAQRLAAKYRDTSYMKTETYKQALSKAVARAWAEGKKQGHSGWHHTDKVKEECRERAIKYRKEMIQNDWHRNGPGK